MGCASNSNETCRCAAKLLKLHQQWLSLNHHRHTEQGSTSSKRSRSFCPRSYLNFGPLYSLTGTTLLFENVNQNTAARPFTLGETLVDPHKVARESLVKHNHGQACLLAHFSLAPHARLTHPTTLSRQPSIHNNTHINTSKTTTTTDQQWQHPDHTRSRYVS